MCSPAGLISLRHAVIAYGTHPGHGKLHGELGDGCWRVVRNDRLNVNDGIALTADGEVGLDVRVDNSLDDRLIWQSRRETPFVIISCRCRCRSWRGCRGRGRSASKIEENI